MKSLHILELVLKRIAQPLWRTYTFVHFFRIGKGFGYPTCCVAHFAWNAADPKFRKARRGMAKERGTINHRYVPCGYHRRHHPRWIRYRAKSLDQLRLFSDRQFGDS